MMLSSISWICWLAPNSVFIHQLGSGLQGIGLGSFGIDWSVVTSYFGSPLVSPWHATANVAVGFALVMYLMTPLMYFKDLYNAKNFPIYSNEIFTANGSVYDTLGIINSDFEIDMARYAEAGKVHLSTFFAMTYGIGFATLSATIVHVILFHGK